MSAPDNLFVRHDAEVMTQVRLTSHAGEALFLHLLPRLQRLELDLADQFEGEYYGEVLSIAHIPAQYYPQVCRWIMQACEELAVLKPHQADLRQALESDPRFKQLQAA